MNNFLSRTRQQARAWKQFGMYSPLIFLAFGSIAYGTHLLNLPILLILGLSISAVIAVIWWFWVLYTVIKLSKLLESNYYHFAELLDIVRDLNTQVRDVNIVARERGVEEKN